MAKIKTAELFYSIQGEGRYMGVPSVFLRTFGCNFSCRGFGMAASELSQEPERILQDIDQYQTYEELPLAATGCDSYASWHPKFKHLSPVRETDELAESIVKLLPAQSWQNEHLVITGGEPLLGWQRSYPDLLDHPVMQPLREITFETNGTQELTKEFKHYLQDWASNPRHGRQDLGAVTFSVSAKLSCSGEFAEEAICPHIVVDYQSAGFTYLKFVIATEADAVEAITAVKTYRAAGFHGPVYLMPVGGTSESYNMNAAAVANFALQHGLRYSDRLQVPLFKNAWGT